MKFPPEIDELMWQVAEADDPQALQEFEERYPEFQPEMAKRLGMVRGLKGSRPVKATKRREHFMPSRQVRNVQPAIPGWAMVLVVFAAIAGVSFATFGAYQFFQNQQPQLANQSEEPSTPTSTASNAEGTPGYQVPTPSKEPLDPLEEARKNAQPSPFQTPVTVVASRIELRNALQEIAVQAGVELELAPNFPDAEIYIDYRDVPAITVLEHMGRNFGFTPFTQTTRKALLIPAVDDQFDQDSTTPTGLSGNADDRQNRRSEGRVSELPF